MNRIVKIIRKDGKIDILEFPRIKKERKKTIKQLQKEAQNSIDKIMNEGKTEEEIKALKKAEKERLAELKRPKTEAELNQASINKILDEVKIEKPDIKTDRDDEIEKGIADIFGDTTRINISDLQVSSNYKSIESNEEYFKHVKDPRKRNRIIIACLLAFGIIGSFGTYGYMKYSEKIAKEKDIARQENLLKDELFNLIKLNLLTDSINIEVKSQGDYGYIEKEVKNYYLEISSNLQLILDITNDEDFNSLSSLENLKKDDDELNNSFAIINKTKLKYKNTMDTLKREINKDRISKLINRSNLNTYFKNLYDDLMYSDDELDYILEYQEYINDIDKHETVLINKTEELIKFLKEQKGKWKIENDEFKSDSEFITLKYQQLVNAINEEKDQILLINVQNGYSYQE